VHSPGVAAAAGSGRAVECSVCSLHQRGMRAAAVRTIVEVLEQGEASSVGVELEHDAGVAAGGGRAVERAVGCLDQPGKGESAPRGVEAEAVEHDETGPVGVELEHSAVVADTTLVGCAVERAVGPLHQASIGLATLAQVDSGRKALEHSEFAPVRVQLESWTAVDTATE